MERTEQAETPSEFLRLAAPEGSLSRACMRALRGTKLVSGTTLLDSQIAHSCCFDIADTVCKLPTRWLGTSALLTADPLNKPLLVQFCMPLCTALEGKDCNVHQTEQNTMFAVHLTWCVRLLGERNAVSKAGSI